MGRVFAAAYAHVYHRIDHAVFRKVRARWMPRARGRTLEIGCGTGLNLSYLPPGIEYVGADPDPAMLAYARKLEKRGRLAVARAERLPFPDASFDTVVSTFAFCSVGDPSAAALEVTRVLKDEGIFLFLEHVRSRSRFWRWLQNQITPLWSRALAGCHLNRPLLETLAAVGLGVKDLHNKSGGLIPIVWGEAINSRRRSPTCPRSSPRSCSSSQERSAT